MGSGIATAHILNNIYVVLKEVNSEYLLKGIKTIEGGYVIQCIFFFELRSLDSLTLDFFFSNIMPLLE